MKTNETNTWGRSKWKKLRTDNIVHARLILCNCVQFCYRVVHKCPKTVHGCVSERNFVNFWFHARRHLHLFSVTKWFQSSLTLILNYYFKVHCWRNVESGSKNDKTVSQILNFNYIKCGCVSFKAGRYEIDMFELNTFDKSDIFESIL